MQVIFLLALTISPGDKIKLFLWPDTAASGVFVVQEDGSCNFPVLGKFPVAGKEPEALRQELEKAYSKYYSAFTLTLEPLYRVFVAGEVRQPGAVYITGSESVLAVVAMAGPTADADLSGIKLVKKKGSKTVNLSKAIKNGLSAIEAGIESGDVIVVPRRFLARARDWSVVFGLISAALSLYVYLSTR